MSSTLVTISKDLRGIYWAHKIGKHLASKTHAEAKASAKQLFDAAGGEGKAEIRDLTGEANDD
ncbi:hypothetical protein [Mesorhizobium sp. WSM2239]|uniref:DUF2188 domain-containing protein n=2 Tax=unclassified Mesorhizobium TaxID=325217 RepID=A0AAU8D3R1_9HYPH